MLLNADDKLENILTTPQQFTSSNSHSLIFILENPNLLNTTPTKQTANNNLNHTISVNR